MRSVSRWARSRRASCRSLDGNSKAFISRWNISRSKTSAPPAIPVTDEPITAKGKRVVIIGGGDTGSDCLGTTHRQGCVEVHQFELLPEPPPQRADSTPWPLWPMQLRTSHAHEEGCDRQWSVSTTKFTGHNGHVTKLHGQRVKFEGGKFTLVPNTEFEMDADLVLLAMGFTGPVKNGLLDSLGVKYDARGTVGSTTTS